MTFNKMLQIIFIVMVVYNLIKMIVLGHYLNALIAYSFIPIVIWMIGKLLYSETLNILKIYVAWIPMTFSETISDWVKK